MAFADAFWVTGTGSSEIRRAPIPTPGPNDVQVQTLYSAVSRGTESLVYLGRVPKSEFTRMRAPHQEGEFPGPVKYGYANVGRVLKGPANLVSRVVFCLFPHQSHYSVPAEEVVLVPEEVPANRAVLAANMETALNAVWDAGLQVGDRVSVVGAGVVGCLTAYLGRRILGVDVELVDVNPERSSIASALGVHFSLPEAALRNRDVVFHTSGSPQGLLACLELAAPDTEILELSWYGDQEVSLPLGQSFHAQRLHLRSSQVGTVSPNARPRFNHKSRLKLALSLLADPVLDALFTADCDFPDLPRVMNELAEGRHSPLCQRVAYTASSG